LAARFGRAFGSGGCSKACTKASCSSRDSRIDSCSAITRRAASCALVTTNSLNVRPDSAAACWSKRFCAAETRASSRSPRVVSGLF